LYCELNGQYGLVYPIGIGSEDAVFSELYDCLLFAVDEVRKGRFSNQTISQQFTKEKIHGQTISNGTLATLEKESNLLLRNVISIAIDKDIDNKVDTGIYSAETVSACCL
jgi:hypothetical protein